MKRLAKLTLLALFVLLLTVPVSAGVKITPKKTNMVVGQTKKLKVNTKKKVKWSSSKKKVASVNSKGVVTAKNPGTAKIYAKVGKKKYTCTVKVYDEAHYLTRTFAPTNDTDEIYIESTYGSSLYDSVVKVKVQYPKNAPVKIDPYLIFHISNSDFSIDSETHYPYYYLYIDKVLIERLYVPVRLGMSFDLKGDAGTSGTHILELVCYEDGDPTKEAIVYRKFKYKVTIKYI